MNKIRFFFVFVFFLFIIPLTLAGTMTASVSKQTVMPGETFQFIFDSPTRTPIFWSYDIGLPLGFDNANKICAEWPGDILKCRLRGQLRPLPYSISVKASTVPGTYTFSENKYLILVTDQEDSIGQLTNNVAVTVCAPQCTGKVCGADDTCGGKCVVQTCDTGYTCSSAGACIPNTCTDTCTSKGYVCGTQTICGSSVNCGSCNTGYSCSAAGICVLDGCTKQCTGKVCGADDGCGGKCVVQTCDTGYTCSSAGACIADPDPINPLYLIAGFFIVLMLFGMMSRRR